ncbi:hypothetical protein [Pedobacter heparinus]|nr:hypothetical protein [Pedobacter heparinus]
MKALLSFLAIPLLFYTSANAQIPSNKFKDTYKDRVQKDDQYQGHN